MYITIITFKIYYIDNYKPLIMKKLFTLLFFSFFINIALSQTNTFTVYYFDVKPGMESALADVFDSFYEGVEFKSGGVY